MGIQEVVVALLFLVAIAYVGRMIYKNARAKEGCGTNCKCGVDFSNIELPEHRKN